MKILKLVFVAAITALTFGCGSSSSNEKGSTSELDGTWVGACSADEGTSSDATDVFGSGQLSRTSKGYSDASCVTQTGAMTVSFPFATGAAVTTPAGAKEITFSPTTKVTITLKTDLVVSEWNGTASEPAVCGGGFVKNVTKEVNATACGVEWAFLFDTANFYDIYKIVDAKLFTGDCGEDGTATDCTSAAKRATTLGTDFSTKI